MRNKTPELHYTKPRLKENTQIKKNCCPQTVTVVVVHIAVIKEKIEFLAERTAP
jgi:hypothetical protein